MQCTKPDQTESLRRIYLQTVWFRFIGMRGANTNDAHDLQPLSATPTFTFTSTPTPGWHRQP